MEALSFLLFISGPYMLIALLIFVLIMVSVKRQRRRIVERKETVPDKIGTWLLTLGLSAFTVLSFVIPEWHITSSWPTICSGLGLACAAFAGWHAGYRRWGQLVVAALAVPVAAFNFAVDVASELG